jgi:asparagine synthase (glutamine-hydrolysing)
MINVELKNRLPELLLMRVDKMSMAHSIETRVPYLDEDLVEFALTIPSNLKIRNGVTKYILKKAAQGIIPDEIIYRKKWGFCGSATNMLGDRLRHRRHKRFNSFKIWNLLNLVLWHDCWFS